MKKLALTLGLFVILGIVAVYAQDQQRSMQMKDTSHIMQMKDTSHMKGKKPVQKKASESYHMKKGSTKQVKPPMQKMEDTSKIKSKSEPVYKK